VAPGENPGKSGKQGERAKRKTFGEVWRGEMRFVRGILENKLTCSGLAASQLAEDADALIKRKEQKTVEMTGLLEKIQARFKIVKKQPYALLGIKDPQVDGFLENSSLGTLMDFLGIKPSVHLSNLDVDANWGKAIANNPVMRKYRDALYSVPDEQLSFADMHHEIKSKIGEIAKIVPGDPELEGRFAIDFDPKILMAVFVNEHAPHYMGRPDEKYFMDKTGQIDEQVFFTQKARIEFYRMMLEAGWQPQKAPAQNVVDNQNKVESFGVDQCIKPTAEGITRNHGSHLEGILPAKFEDQVTLEDQVARSLVLAYENLHSLETRIESYKDKWKDKFRSVYEKASAADKHRFVMALVAAMHNNGGRGSKDIVGKALRVMMTDDYGTLEYARRAFLGAMNGKGKGKKYTKRTAELFDNLKMVDVYRELEELNPIYESDDDQQERVWDRNVDDVSLKDLGFKPTTVCEE